MMESTYHKLHAGFKFNGFAYTYEDLKEVGYSFIKEGEAYEQEIGDFLLDWLDDKPTVEVQTSGSTGTPKPILLQKQQMLNSALATGEFFGLNEGDTALLCLPTKYIAGKMMLVRAMVLGLDLARVEPSSDPLSGVYQQFDFCAMTPLQLEGSLEKIDQIKTLIVGGAPLSLSLKDKVQNKSTKIFETYGMTETITHIAVKKINHKAAHTFKTLSGVLVSKDARNCLVINAPNISDLPVVTNDLVKIISETEFDWRGRCDNIINSGGVKLVPEEIEGKLASVIESRFFVAGLPDKKLGQKLVLVVEGDFNSDELLHRIKASIVLDKHEIPKSVFFISKFTETETGKISREANLKILLG